MAEVDELGLNLSYLFDGDIMTPFRRRAYAALRRESQLRLSWHLNISTRTPRVPSPEVLKLIAGFLDLGVVRAP